MKNPTCRYQVVMLKTCVILAFMSVALGAQAATVLQGSASTYVAFEGEGNPTIIPGTLATWVPTNDAPASGGSTLYISGGPGINGTAPHSFAHYKIKFAVAGTYSIYYRWRADPARTATDEFTANSFFIGNIFGSFSTPDAAGRTDFYQSTSNGINAPASNVYDWQMEATTYTVTAEQVTAGVPLVLSVGTREAGFMLDRLILSTTAGLSDNALDGLANSDTSTVVQGASDNYVAFEGETKPAIIPGTLATWVPTNDAPASGGSTLYISGGPGINGTAPHSFAQYQIKFAVAGTYSIYYRWRADPARTATDEFTANSFFIGNIFGSFSTPDAAGRTDFYQSTSNGINAPASNVYDWQMEATTYTVTAEQVTAGVPLVLSVGTREAGFMLDRLVLSTTAGLTDNALDLLPNSGSAVAAPAIDKAVGSASLTTVSLVFTRPLAAATVLANRFTLSGNVAVTAAVLDGSDPRRVTLTTAAQTQGTVYTVTVTNVTDTSNTPVAPNTTKNFTAWKLVDGWATAEIYNGAGATVADLLALPEYQAGTPNEVRWLKGFSLNNDPRIASYGAEISAFFVPPTAGVHNFYPYNDDEAELLLSSNQTEAGLQSLSLFPDSPAFVFDDAVVVASPALTASQKYLLVGRVKSGGGDFVLNVASQPATSVAPAAGLPVLGGTRISTYVNPDLGNVTFNQQPAPATAAAGDRARFTVKVTTTETPVYYQWRVGGVDIPGATRPTYYTPVLSAADNNKVYSVVVSVAGKDTPSTGATLTVQGLSTNNLQPYIGVNFVGAGDNSLPGRLTAADLAGVVVQENWNNLTGGQFVSIALNDAAGAASPVTLDAQANGQFYSGALATGDADGALLQGFLHTGTSTTPLLITLGSVPPGNYSVIVYSLGFAFQANYEEGFEVTGAGTYPTYHVKAETGFEYINSPGYRRMTSTNANNRGSLGNYVQFDNVSPAVDGSLVISATWEATTGYNQQPAVNAIQLLKVVPVLTASSAGTGGGNLTIGLNVYAVGYTLESSLTLGPGASWNPVPGVPNPITAAGSVNVPITSGSSYFRLRKN